jgi:hypothetical protein
VIQIEAARTRLKAKIAEIEARAERGRVTGAGVGVAKPPKFDRTTSCALFHRQFKTIAEHNCWMCQEKSTLLITALQGRAIDERPVKKPWRTASGTSTWPLRITVR